MPYLSLQHCIDNQHHNNKTRIGCQSQLWDRNFYFLLRAFLFTFISHSSVYVEFGATSSDTIALTHTLGSTTSTLKWNILAQQIPCTANYRCHEFLVQKGTKIVLVWTNDLKGHRQTACSGSLEPQGWCTATTLLEARSVSKDTLDQIHYWWFCYGGNGGLTGRRILCIYTLCSQFLGSQDYTNCIRTEDGFCGIEWKEKSGTSNGEITILLVFPHFKSKRLLVPRFEIPLPQMLSISSAEPQRSQRLLVQPWASTFPTSGNIWNVFQVPRTLTWTRQHN